MDKINDISYNFAILVGLIATSLIFVISACDSRAQVTNSHKTKPSDKLGGGVLTYSGEVSGKFKPHSVGCAVVNGKIANVTAAAGPDSLAPHFPFIAANSPGSVTFGLDPGNIYIHMDIKVAYIATEHKKGKWIATFNSLKLPESTMDPIDPKNDSFIIISGELTCGSDYTTVLNL